ncbi:MAG TPA: CoA transferase [Acidimicrobiales bacterium]|nr:CoA transferase [Acidimicrobiales bacterium]
MSAPLEGIIVIDFTRLIAGPSATDLLASLGARVIKVESVGGDPMRYMRSKEGGSGPSSPTFNAYNTLKQSIVLDLKDESDREVALALSARADVVVETFRPGVMERLGLGPSAIRALNPGVVYASLSAFSASGSMATRGGVDIVMQAESGLMSVTGEMGGGPLKVGVPIVDAAAGYALALGIVAALVGRARTGEGDDVTVSMLDVGVHLQAQTMAEFLATGTAPVRVGNCAPYAAPADVYPTAKGDLVLSAHLPEHWRRLCRLLDAPALFDDPRFIDTEHRVAHRDELSQVLTEALSTRTAGEWVELLSAEGLTAGEIRSYADVMASSDVVEHETIAAAANVDNSSLTVVRSPLRFRGWSDQTLTRKVPRLDEHGVEVRAFAIDPEALDSSR